MIEDKELRELFRIESEEHLQRLDQGLLQLERTPADQTLLDELFREAHSLKGAARMMGLTEIQNLAHQIENVMGSAKRGEAALLPQTPGLYQTLDTIRSLIREATDTGGVKPTQKPAETEPTAISPAETPQPIPPPKLAPTVASLSHQPEVRAAKPENFRIETIRVDPKKLDALLTQSGELTVTKIRIARRLAEIDELLDLCDEGGRIESSRQLSSSDARQALQRLERLQAGLKHLRSGAYEDSTRLDFIAGQIEDGIHRMRLLPLSTLFCLFPRLVHDLARDLGKEVELVVEGAENVADKHILEEMKDPLMHLLRNAIDHGIEPPQQRELAGKPRVGRVRIQSSQTPSHIVIEVSDDGQGLDLDAIKRTAMKQGICDQDGLDGMSLAQLQALILASGFSTSAFVTDVSGRGVGLDVVRNSVERLKGTVQIESTWGQGLSLRMQLPISLATVRVMTFTANGQSYALPVEYVQFSRKLRPNEIYPLEGRQTVSLDGQPVSVARLLDLLEISPPTRQPVEAPSTLLCIVLAVGEERFGLIADELLDEMEVVLKPQSALLKRVRNLSGATILETGEVCMVLNPPDLLKSLCKPSVSALALPIAEVPAVQKVLLLAEDSITTRTQEKRILEGAGYEVVTAVDGMEAFNKLGTRRFDGIVSDINMPNIDGLTLTAKIRADKKYPDLPIILVTSLASEEDKRRGLEVGANAYISKPSFDQRVLLDCLERLIP
ncbi:MAG: hybrid sensor histidine kinase/response regulator [Methylococcaceae bacterium]|nr:hybrid sensor histidine kinase/response regulator [Methylococcaceae bacterium]